MRVFDLRTAPMSSSPSSPTPPLWLATTASGDSQVFYLKLIAEDWAGPGGRVEPVKDFDTVAGKMKGC